MDRIYCYPGTDILVNKLNIQNHKRLLDAERKLTNLRILDLLENPVKGSFDLTHLQAIHRYIFQDIYTWAGKIRTVDIAKKTMFCKVQFIQSQANDIFRKLKMDHYLEGFSQRDLALKLAFYFSEINALHPFREGNGRSQREFIRELALHNGYKLSFAKISEQEMLDASVDSFLCNYEKMEQIFLKSLK
jgi:cell filamentation protein